MKQYCLLFFLLLCMVACKPTISSEYIQPGEMEDILYDYQLAQAMGTQVMDGGQTADDVDKNVYKLAVLKKHGITQTQFDTSLQYYLRHTEELHKIYENLAERLSKEAVALGSSVNDINDFGSIQKGDTTNVWNKASAFILSPDEGLNQEVFTIKPDTSYHKGDKLMLQMESQFVIQDGSRDAVAFMAVTLSNDSIVTQTCRISSDGRHAITFNDTDRLGVKLIRGFFILNRGDNDSQSTLKLVCLYNVQLIRMHTDEPSSSADDISGPNNGPQGSNPAGLPKGDSIRKTQPNNARPGGPQKLLAPPTDAPMKMEEVKMQ